VLEEQDFVYRSGDPASVTPAASQPSELSNVDAPWRLTLRPDPPLLFRFSALTANAHRIHYDALYTCDVERLPGLVVHGPLLAVFMLELPRRETPARRVASLAYRFRSPVFVGSEIHSLGVPTDGGATLRIATAQDACHATAEITYV